MSTSFNFKSMYMYINYKYKTNLFIAELDNNNFPYKS
jgi:hypothetical protein